MTLSDILDGLDSTWGNSETVEPEGGLLCEKREHVDVSRENRIGMVRRLAIISDSEG